MILVGVSSFFPPPTWITENEHGPQLVHCASIAATFIGWYVVSMTPRWLPTIIVNIDGGQQDDDRDGCGLLEDRASPSRAGGATPTPRA